MDTYTGYELIRDIVAGVAAILIFWFLLDCPWPQTNRRKSQNKEKPDAQSQV